MIDVIEAIKILKDNIKEQNENILVNLLDAVGYTLSEDIYSQINVPEFPKSAMDGYAVNHLDLEQNDEFKVIDEIYAGEHKSIRYIPNTAIRVMTGAFIPNGYDCVVKQEDTDYGENVVNIKVKEKEFSNYCHKGEDIEKGELILKKGIVITSVHIGIFASLGIDKIKVVKPLRVSLLSTGSELLYPGEKLKDGKIYCSTLFTLNSYLKKYNIDIVNLEIVEDNLEVIKKKVQEFVEISDVIITTGGVSVGKYDLIPELYNSIANNILFRKVAMKPGTPVSSARINNTIIISFSGNPFAALANFQVLFWPIAEKYYNSEEFSNIVHEKIIEGGYLKCSKLQRYVRARYENEKVYVENIHSSSVISNLLNCNCLIVQEPNRELKKGEKVKVIYLP
ncbi:molybdopterin molybdotransferase MoeA [Miniphocaeibacter massiliensis]|uniref:molybdopterin molybdotransferase MoeA n=1 Tax=Miniphocaeibacter massiliensis TaxID=2041841 RepID=UPI000C07B8B3|nr:molybdopterin molybdotransferase MoeA [Miniphocaeibacter massiliensis]